MALSTALINRLNCHDSDEPLAKRLKLAENVLYSVEIPISRKQDCIFNWFCSHLSDENEIEVWKTIYHCLSIDPINFSQLSLESKNILTEKLIQCLNAYPKREVSEEMVKSSTYIFSNANSQSYASKNKVVLLLETLLTFTCKVISSKELGDNYQFQKKDVVIECVEHAIGTIVQLCKQNFSDKKNFVMIFIEEILFPLSILSEMIKFNKISSKLIVESQKCIKKLILDDIRNNVPSPDENNVTEENEIFFNTLKNKIKISKLEDIKAVFNTIFNCTIYNFRQNPNTVDFILRQLYKCVEQKELSKQILASFLENSVDISYDFENEINGISFKQFLCTQIEEIQSKKKCFKCSDYELLSAIGKLNPVLIEDLIQTLLERILFEKKTNESEIIAYGNFITELWKSTVRLRRQHKFISRFLLAIKSLKKEKEDFKFINKFKLPEKFITEFGQDLKSRTTSAQIMAIFNTLLFHLKTDCLNELKVTGHTNQVCLSIKIVEKFLVVLFEHSNFLDNSLTFDWQDTFYRSFTDLHNTLTEFSESLSDSTVQHETIIIISFSNIVKIWCEVYDLLRYYIPNIFCHELNFPINENQLKLLKQIVKECNNQDCSESLNQLILLKLIIYNRNNQKLIKEKFITHHWSIIIKHHFEIIEFFTEKQILNLTLHLVKEASCTQENLVEWILILKKNISRITKKFATAAALQCFLNIFEDIESCSTKTIIENIDFEIVLKSMNDPKSCKKALQHAMKQIAKQDFQCLNIINFNKIQRNLKLMSNLPLSYLDTRIRKFLFMVLYVFDNEVRTTEFKEFITNIYIDLLCHNDIDILNNVSKPKIVINYFKDSPTILFKVIKLSLKKLSILPFWEKFVNKKACNKKISSILLICLDNSKNKVIFNDHKSTIQNLILKLSNKIINELDVEINNSYEIAGLRVLLKIVLSEKQKLKDNLKSYIELTLNNITKNTAKLLDDKLIYEILQLSLLVLQHREHFKVTDNVLQNLCIIFINNPNRKIFFYFLEILKDNEFQFFVNSINNRTKESLKNSNVQVLEKVTLIWECLSKAEAKVTRSKSVSSSVNNLLKDLLVSEIKDFSSTFLLKIYRTFVTSKRMIRLTHILVDSIFVTSMESLNDLSKETKLITCQEALGLCSDFMRSKVDFILDRLPILVNFFRKIVTIILQEIKYVDISNEHLLKILAVDIEKCCAFFAKLKKDVVRISPYLIADLINTSFSLTLPNFMKVSIDFSISHLLTNCDRHAISFLFRTLPVSSQQVFKTAYQNYLKYNKFTGKI